VIKCSTPHAAKVSVVIAARNEAANIKKRINNLRQQDFPDTLEIIVVSDGSTDATVDIIDGYLKDFAIERRKTPDGTVIKLIVLPLSRGKAHALNIGVEQATGEIIVFADARQEFNKAAIKELAGNFRDPKVGCVSGELIFYKHASSSIQSEMETYWNYEKFVRKLESLLHSVCGATGSIYAIRKSLFKKMPDDLLLDDVYVPMHIVLQGYRTVFEEKATAYDYVSKDFDVEKRRKIRTLVGNWQLLRIMPLLLLPYKNPIIAQYVSHKVLRLIIPFCFLGCVFSSLFIPELFYRAAFWSMILLLLLPHFENKLRKIRILALISRISRTIITLNYYALLSCFYFIRKNENVWVK
jgi:poly-beta-1,6-N-acetyl-D-glucosamine synthase